MGQGQMVMLIVGFGAGVVVTVLVPWVYNTVRGWFGRG